jgi:hypothetical protein
MSVKKILNRLEFTGFHNLILRRKVIGRTAFIREWGNLQERRDRVMKAINNSASRINGLLAAGELAEMPLPALTGPKETET